MAHPGILIAFEGIDGSGKSTPLPTIADWIKSKGREALVTHEPRRDSAIGRKIYDMLDGRKPMCSPIELQRLYIEDRFAHTRDEIAPALEGGTIVLADRYWFSTIAFGMLNVPRQKLIDLHQEVFGGTFKPPHLTFIFDVSPEVAMNRLRSIGKGTDHFERYEKLVRVREHYRQLAALDLCQTVVLDASQPPQAIIEIITRQLKPLITPSGGRDGVHARRTSTTRKHRFDYG